MNKESKKTTSELRAAFSEADKQLEKALQDTEFIKGCIGRLTEINHNIDTLNEFYHSPMWMEGRDELCKLFPAEHFSSAGEDSIWDVSQELYFLKIRLMKLLADDLHKTIPEHGCV